MKHFHLSQGDKRAGLERPLYLQKKIKSALTLAPLIGNTCWLVIVLNSLWSRSRVFAPARDGRGICMEFLPIQRLRGGDIPWPKWQRSAAVRGFRPPEGRRSWSYCRRAVPAPLALPRSSPGAGEGSKDSPPKLSPTGSLLPGGFTEREREGGATFPRAPDGFLGVSLSTGSPALGLRSSSVTMPAPLRFL